jgi:cytochrome P450
VNIATLNRTATTDTALDRHAHHYADATRPLSELVRLEDPAFYVDPWPVYRRLQREAPVYFDERLNTWIVTTYDEVRHVARTPSVYSAAHGILLLDGVKKSAAAAELFAGSGDFIGFTDPPRHDELRRIMQPPFTPPSLARLGEDVERHSARLLDEVEPGAPVDWVDAVAARLPVMVIASVLGIDTDDDEFFAGTRAWSDAVEDVASRDLTPAEAAAGRAAFRSLNDYILRVFDRKRRDPGDDFLSSLLAAELDGRRLSQDNMIGFTQALMAAGSDTVRALLAETVAHLGTHPDQLAALVADRSLVPQAVEEVLRFAPPARAFARQVVAPTTLRGQVLHPGQRVRRAFDAANRDPAIFEEPHLFDALRARSRRNVAFGFGTHVCIAAPLARAEAATVLSGLLHRFPRFEIADGGMRVESFLRNGWARLPVVFHAA